MLFPERLYVRILITASGPEIELACGERLITARVRPR
jgi:hypothetical protein